MRASRATALLLTLVAVFTASAAFGQCVDVSQSTCSVFIIQNPSRPQCIDNFVTDVARLCPLGDWDVVTFGVIARDANGDPIQGVSVKPVPTGGTLNLATGGYTTAVTNASGAASISVSAASGCGGLSVCWDDGCTPVIFGCRADVRSPDVNKGSTPALCGLSTSASCVASSDIANPVCGFLVSFGPVTPGVNGCWDMNCDNNVNAFDVNGILAKGGVAQHFGHCGTLGTVEVCP